MKATTQAIIRAALEGDSSIGAEERREWERAMAEGIGAAAEAGRKAAENAPPLEPVVRHKELARLTGMTERSLREIANRAGLVRVYGHGTRRSMGYTRASVRAWLGTRAPA